MYRTILIGSNPSQAASSDAPFQMRSKSGKILRGWLLDAAIWDFSLYNVANVRTPNNRPLKVKEIKAAIPTLLNAIKYEKMISKKDVRLVAVGKTAEKALTLLHLPFYSLPHPSGLNRQLNDPKFIEEKLKGLQSYCSPSKV